MHRAINAMRVSVEGFVRQRDAFAMVVTAGPLETAVLAAAVRALDDAGADLVFTWTHDVVNLGAWVDVAHETLAGLRDALLAEGLPAPPLPPARRGGDPATHVRALMTFTRDLRADPQDAVALWVLLPHRVASPVVLAALLGAVAPGDRPAPWYRGVRWIVCTAGVEGEAVSRASMPGVVHLAPDLGPAALTVSLEADVDDEAAGLPARMAALMALAGIDLAWGRLARAAEKYALLVDYHRATGERAHLAAAHAGLGEIYARAGRAAEARTHLEAALPPAEESGAWPVVLSTAIHLAEFATAEGRAVEAVDLWRAAGELAGALGQTGIRDQCRVSRDAAAGGRRAGAPC